MPQEFEQTLPYYQSEVIVSSPVRPLHVTHIAKSLFTLSCAVICVGMCVCIYMYHIYDMIYDIIYITYILYITIYCMYIYNS